MKKSTFVATLLGTISGLFFALGMCMAILPEWNAFRPGVILGCVGVVFALITIFIWRKMEDKSPIKINGKTILTAIVGIAGALLLGLGMCQIMVWSNLILGIIIGIFGIAVMLCLIPLCVGLK